MKKYNILSIDEFKTIIENNSRLLGIDPGNKNIGFAICDENKKVATPLKILQKSKFTVLIKQINLIIRENNIKGIVIGNPINMDGTSGKSSQSASDFAKNLSKNITIPITMWDERLSSEGSFKITKELNTNVTNRVNKLDKNAAAFILQGAIDYLSN
jgi:putative Holliday junction resolvase